MAFVILWPEGENMQRKQLSKLAHQLFVGRGRTIIKRLQMRMILCNTPELISCILRLEPNSSKLLHRIRHVNLLTYFKLPRIIFALIESARAKTANVHFFQS